MHPLLAKLLQKRNVKSIDELSSEPMPDGSPTDRQTFEQWQRILSEKEEITVEKVREFCERQIHNIQGQMKNLDNSPQKNERLILLLNVYTTMRDVLQSSQAERENLERYLQALITNF